MICSEAEIQSSHIGILLGALLYASMCYGRSNSIHPDMTDFLSLSDNRPAIELLGEERVPLRLRSCVLAVWQGIGEDFGIESVPKTGQVAIGILFGAFNSETGLTR